MIIKKVYHAEFRNQSKKNKSGIMPTKLDANCVKFIDKKVFPSQIRLLVLDAEYFSENDKTCDISVYMFRDDGQGHVFWFPFVFATRSLHSYSSIQD